MAVTSEYDKARELLWNLVDACTHRMQRCPHAVPALSTERDKYALEAIRLTPDDASEIRRINVELPRRLVVLEGKITW